MAYRLDYDEPVPAVIQRLKREHLELRNKLLYIQEEAQNRDPKVAKSILESIKFEILRHAVEEEARLLRVIESEGGEKSRIALDITRYHRRVTEFLHDDLPVITQGSEMKARKGIQEFVTQLLIHNDMEEEVVFPLALQAYELQNARKR
ncbi:MAG: hemerythrin domain-containing protein [Thaumarchaeota archaeon]|nr:hemerythrin domain-containing protein [Nitrososphaerota archaeon]